jgi:hypothetical protein
MMSFLFPETSNGLSFQIATSIRSWRLRYVQSCLWFLLGQSAQHWPVCGFWRRILVIIASLLNLRQHPKESRGNGNFWDILSPSASIQELVWSLRKEITQSSANWVHPELAEKRIDIGLEPQPIKHKSATIPGTTIDYPTRSKSLLSTESHTTSRFIAQSKSDEVVLQKLVLS